MGSWEPSDKAGGRRWGHSLGTDGGRVGTSPLNQFSLLGHMRIQQFRKKDGSFGAWLHRDSSTW